MRIEVINTKTTPATIDSYDLPKTCTYTMNSSGSLIFTIIRVLALSDVTLNKLKQGNKAQPIMIRIYHTINGEEIEVRSFNAVFYHYVLEEVSPTAGEAYCEETIRFEVIS